MLRPVALSLLMLGAMACQARELPELTPLWQQQKGWISACDNRRDCQLLYVPNIEFAEQVNHLTLIIRSQAGPEGGCNCNWNTRGAIRSADAAPGWPAAEPGLLAALVLSRKPRQHPRAAVLPG